MTHRHTKKASEGKRSFRKRDSAPNILIVDDHEERRRLFSSMLRANGCRCLLAANGTEARAVLEGPDVELVLCDVMMPGGSGLDLIKFIVGEYPGTAVVMVSGIHDPKIAEVALELGGYGYITEPFGANDVRINVASALRRRRLEIETRRHRDRLKQQVRDFSREKSFVSRNPELRHSSPPPPTAWYKFPWHSVCFEAGVLERCVTQM
ncbi:MAG TPA: response regulator [Syntrophobacteria bacterium]|nr:response regulator [Syntrophobacteria bacterium]